MEHTDLLRAAVTWLAELQERSQRAADVAAACRKAEREWRTSLTVALAKQLWKELLLVSGLEELSAVGPVPDPYAPPAPLADDAQVRAAGAELQSALADLTGAVAAVEAVIAALVEPPRGPETLDLVPATLIEVPPAVVSHLLRQMAYLEIVASQVRRWHDELLGRILAAMQRLWEVKG